MAAIYIRDLNGTFIPISTIRGDDGEDAFVYIASASSSTGANFTYPANISQDYLAILNVTTEISTPAVEDFAGLWFSKIDVYRGAVIGGYTGTQEQFYIDIALVSTKENALPATPATPEDKFLNALKQWATINHSQLVNPNSDEDYQHFTKGAQTIEGVKTFSSPIKVATPTTTGEAESTTNKKTSITDSDTDYPSTKAVKTVIEADEETIALALVTLRNEVTALKQIIFDMVLGSVQIDNLDIVKTLNMYGSTNMILSGTAAPSVVPDFIGQFFIKTSATTACYQATGITAVGDWKQIG